MRKRITLLNFFFLLSFTGFIAACQAAVSDETVEDVKSGSGSMTFSTDSTLFEIMPESSEARFLIDEVLYGQEKTVVGSTNQVNGQIAVDFVNPLATAVGPVQINMRTLQTDNPFRNGSLQNRILLTNLYEFATFTPTSISGLPAEIIFGEPVMFEMRGDLAITDYTNEVVFAVTAVALSATQLEGTAATSIQRADYDLTIPSATGVASVGETVTLELDFVAIMPSE